MEYYLKLIFALHLNKFFITMHNLEHFSLPFLGMKDGIHTYFFDIGDDFFKEFDQSPVEKGSFTIKVVFDKRPNISEMDLFIEGRVKVICDRCLSDIDLPVNGEHHLYVKISSEEAEEEEVIFLTESTSHLYLAQIFYEYICLSLPISNTYDCDLEQPRPCDDAVLSKLTQSNEDHEANESDIWSNLKGFISEN